MVVTVEMVDEIAEDEDEGHEVMDELSVIFIKLLHLLGLQ